MIDKASLSGQWLEEKRTQYKKDPGIIESMIHALYLLDQLMLTGLDFIFKGDTSLVLLMDKLLRFSVDIDIIVDPAITREVLETHLSKIAVLSNFIRMELDVIITSQLPVAKWNEYINEPTLADPIMDRMTAHLHRIELKGESRRKKKNIPENMPS